MELTPAQITEGMLFYGIKASFEFPEFRKFQATKISSKQIKALKKIAGDFATSYEHTLRASDWRYFSDFESARAVWVESVLDVDIQKAEDRLIAAQKRKALMLAADDL